MLRSQVWKLFSEMFENVEIVAIMDNPLIDFP